MRSPVPSGRPRAATRRSRTARLRRRVVRRLHRRPRRRQALDLRQLVELLGGQLHREGVDQPERAGTCQLASSLLGVRRGLVDLHDHLDERPGTPSPCPSAAGDERDVAAGAPGARPGSRRGRERPAKATTPMNVASPRPLAAPQGVERNSSPRLPEPQSALWRTSPRVPLVFRDILSPVPRRSACRSASQARWPYHTDPPPG